MLSCSCQHAEKGPGGQELPGLLCFWPILRAFTFPQFRRSPVALRAHIARMRNALAIIAILLCTSIGWAILGTTIMERSYSADSGLGNRVASIWGGPQEQTPPTAISTKVVPRVVEE